MSRAISTADAFPFTYADAAARWTALIEQVPFVMFREPFSCQGQGPSGEALETQVAYIGSEHAPSVMVLIAGTHGIEGFAGSAVMLDFLQSLVDGHCAPDAGTAVLCIHALNPWGYAWFRRCDAEGVDLNRNFVDFSKTLPANPGYPELAPLFRNPDPQARHQAFADYIATHGRQAWEMAVSGGQYVDPSGPFFGGTGASHGRTVIEAVIERFGLAQKKLAVIDLHTGLGPYGYGEIICDHEPDSEGTRAATAWYGDAVALPSLGTSSSVPKQGLLDYAWHQIMGKGSCFVTLEFGTLGTQSLFDVLFNDHAWWAQQTGLPGSDNISWCAVREAMLHHFYPNDRAWREMVLFRARQVILQTLDGLQAGI
ncbi:MAG: DUF2817 domain-containing protein [Hahellaceae bacterium]|nr:DUF2817 domain-containing protein [Hahellaceae bacterium]MCP5170560.1 DUF2817 domain-containing protein [Hahellaceae bacterium]